MCEILPKMEGTRLYHWNLFFCFMWPYFSAFCRWWIAYVFDYCDYECASCLLFLLCRVGIWVGKHFQNIFGKQVWPVLGYSSRSLDEFRFTTGIKNILGTFQWFRFSFVLLNHVLLECIFEWYWSKVEKKKKNFDFFFLVQRPVSAVLHLLLGNPFMQCCHSPLFLLYHMMHHLKHGKSTEQKGEKQHLKALLFFKWPKLPQIRRTHL